MLSTTAWLLLRSSVPDPASPYGISPSFTTSMKPATPTAHGTDSVHEWQKLEEERWRNSLLVSAHQADNTEAIQKRAIRIIFSLTNDMPYTSALYAANIPTLADRREQLSCKFFKSVLHPTSCLHSLLPPPRYPDLLARLRAPSKFPRKATRTKKYQPFLSHALSKYQT